MKINKSKVIKINKIKIPYYRIIGSIISFLVLFFAFILSIFSNEEKILLYIIGAVSGSLFFLLESIEAIFKKYKVTTDVLMTLAFIGAGLLGQYAESLLLVFLYSITETLETITIQRTRYSIESLFDLVPDRVNKIENGKEIFVKVEQLNKNDIIVLRPGDRSPIDGILVSGTSFVNESIITGESIPNVKMVGHIINAGSFIIDAMIQVKVLAGVSESSIAKIIHLVEEAQKNKTPTHQLINRFTKYFNPFVVILAVFTIIIGMGIGNTFNESAVMGITVLVAAAPCALAIGTPVTVITALGTAGRNKILCKGGLALETLGDLDAIVFDKTGTLTLDKPILRKIITDGIYDELTLLKIVSALEFSTNHPYSKAILEESNNREIDFSIEEQQIINRKTKPGIGVSGILENKELLFGSVDVEKLSSNLSKHYNDLINEGFSVVSLSIDKIVVSLFIFDEIVRDEAKNTIKLLKSFNIDSFLLTGDIEKHALKTGKYLGIDDHNIYWGQKPEDKANVIMNLKNKYKLGMVGDGINDAPSLALADVGIAMGLSGTDIARETADISILSENLNHLPIGISLGKKMKKVVLQNIILSSLIIFGVTAGIFFGFVSLPFAILAHEGSEVLIVGNSLRMLSK